MPFRLCGSDRAIHTSSQLVSEKELIQLLDLFLPFSFYFLLKNNTACVVVFILFFKVDYRLCTKSKGHVDGFKVEMEKMLYRRKLGLSLKDEMKSRKC